MLILHIGLPKTGGGFLQNRIFRKLPDTILVRRGAGPREDKVCATLRKYVSAPGLTAALMRRAMISAGFTKLKQLNESELPSNAILSDENLSLRMAAFWRGNGPGPERVAERLYTLATSVPAQYGPVKILIGLAPQEDWMAARYAEASKSMDRFSQADFDQRMMRIAQDERLAGALGWLDYAQIYKSFAGRFGTDHVVVMRQEQLVDRPQRTLNKLGQKLGGLNLVQPYRKMKRRHNEGKLKALTAEESTWHLRRTDAVLELKEDVRNALRARLSESNAQFLAMTGSAEGSGQSKRRRLKRTGQQKHLQSSASI
ncbi:MAG: hypothetical protein AAGG56_15290 [Pseudomonadota bacterium]